MFDNCRLLHRYISPFGNFQAAAIWAILVLPSLVNLAVLSISISFAADDGDATATTSFFVEQPSGTNISYRMLVRHVFANRVYIQRCCSDTPSL